MLYFDFVYGHLRDIQWNLSEMKISMWTVRSEQCLTSCDVASLFFFFSCSGGYSESPFFSFLGTGCRSTPIPRGRFFIIPTSSGDGPRSEPSVDLSSVLIVDPILSKKFSITCRNTQHTSATTAADDNRRRLMSRRKHPWQTVNNVYDQKTHSVYKRTTFFYPNLIFRDINLQSMPKPC